MSRRPLPLAATVATLAASAVLWPISSTAADEAESTEAQFTYGVDHSAWYWVHQIDEEVALGPLSQRQELPNLQDESTLPVAVESGEPSKVSALRFDLAERGVPEGATVTRLVLTIVEGTDPGEVPTFNPAGNELVACGAADAWSPGEGDLWEAQPESTDECVPGAREELELEDGDTDGDTGDLAPTWTFDLTSLAADWGEDPFSNHGVVFHPAGEGDGGPLDTWQINLKLPLRNDPTTPIDEYEETADRVVLDLAYVPGDGAEEEIDETPEDVGDGIDTGESAEASVDDDFAGGSSGGGSSASGGVEDFEDAEVDEAAMADHDQDDQAVPVASREPFVPAMPWYAWLLIPAVLLATMLVRGALVEPAAATRPDGVIATIRRRNALRRGAALPAKQSLASRLMVALSFGRGASST